MRNKTRELRERATFAVTPAVLFIAQAQTTTTPPSPVPSVSPDGSNAPGGKGLQESINVFGWYALAAAVAGFLLGGAVWALGGRSGNQMVADGGKLGMGVAVGVAFLVGAAAAVIRFAFNAGGA